MIKKTSYGVVLGSLIFLSTNFTANAGCDEIADRNLQVADGMTTGEIRKLIENASASVAFGNEQASRKSN